MQRLQTAENREGFQIKPAKLRHIHIRYTVIGPVINGKQILCPRLNPPGILFQVFKGRKGHPVPLSHKHHLIILIMQHVIPVLRFLIPKNRIVCMRRNILNHLMSSSFHLS
jgi:hypothetical protein